jgi:hypothetical protein
VNRFVTGHKNIVIESSSLLSHPIFPFNAPRSCSPLCDIRCLLPRRRNIAKSFAFDDLCKPWFAGLEKVVRCRPAKSFSAEQLILMTYIQTKQFSVQVGALFRPTSTAYMFLPCASNTVSSTAAWHDCDCRKLTITISTLNYLGRDYGRGTRSKVSSEFARRHRTYSISRQQRAVKGQSAN